jgi:hypothetical protein
LKPKGSLLLTAFGEASHLSLEVARASSLIPLKYGRPKRTTYRWIGAKESTTPSLFMNVLCCITDVKDLGGSPLIQRSSPVSLFMKVLCALAHVGLVLGKGQECLKLYVPNKRNRVIFSVFSQDEVVKV